MTFIIGTPHARGAGYFRNDNTATGGALEQDDVRTCPHCQAVILMRQWKRVESGKLAGGWCSRCSAPLCARCAKKMPLEGCVPFMARIEAGLRADQKLAVFRKLAGIEPPATPREIVITGNG